VVLSQFVTITTITTTTMSFLSRFRPGFRRTSTDLNDKSTTTKDSSSAEKAPETSTEAAVAEDSNAATSDLPNEEAQRGVRMVEAVTLTWSKRALIAIFIKYDCAFLRR